MEISESSNLAKQGEEAYSQVKKKTPKQQQQRRRKEKKQEWKKLKKEFSPESNPVYPT